MKLLLQGTKAEIEGFYHMASVGNCDCRLPCACSGCAFCGGSTGCLLTNDILQFIKDCAEVTLKADEESQRKILFDFFTKNGILFEKQHR